MKLFKKNMLKITQGIKQAEIRRQDRSVSYLRNDNIHGLYCSDVLHSSNQG